jgi:glycosyltransferase involved in cell wall biosynthesis
VPARVLHSIASIRPSYGGPVAVLRGLIKGLAKSGVRPTILTCSTGCRDIDKEDALTFPGIDIIWVTPLIKRFFWSPFFLKDRDQLKTFDLFHVHGVFNGISSFVCHAAKKYQIPFVLEPFGTLSPYCLKKNGILKRLSLSLWELENIRSASAIRFSSEGEYQRFRLNFHNNREAVIGHGLEWAEFSQLPPVGEFREINRLNRQETVFLFLGRLHPIKGLELFIRSFILWQRQNLRKKGVRLIVAGPDEAGYKKKLERLVSDLHGREAVLFVGPLYGHNRIQAIVDADVIVLPSFHENFGMAAVEALACGKPVLISDQVDLWPEVKEYDLGEVAHLSIDGMIEALENIMKRKEEWPIIGQRGRMWTQENCNWDRISRQVLDLYQIIIDATKLKSVIK